MIAKMRNDYHHLVPDLPGHGETMPLNEAGDYNVIAQADRLADFLSAVLPAGHAPVHVAGTSMGGHIAGLLSARHPQLVKSVCLMCPAGVPGDTPVSYSTDGCIELCMYSLKLL